MVEFMSGYIPNMDRGFDEQPVAPMEKVEADIEKPIIPIGEIGTTSIDAGQGNILQELEKNIRMGTKKIQIVFSGRGGSGVTQGGGPSLYGKEVRQALKEKAKATGVELVGVELSPAVISGLAGMDRQSGRITEEQRQADLGKVRDAVRFAADVTGGGCVDLWSQEFNRNIIDAKWNKNKDTGKKEFYDYSPDELKDRKKLEEEGKADRINLTKYLIDDRTGNPIRESVIRAGEKTKEIRYRKAEDVGLNGKEDRSGRKLKEGDFVDAFGNYVNPHDLDAFNKLVPFINDKGEFEVKDVSWEDVEKERDAYNKHNADQLKKIGRPDGYTTEEYLYRRKIETQRAQVRGQSLYYGNGVESMQTQLKDLGNLRNVAEDLQNKMSDEQKREWIRETVVPRLRSEGMARSEEDKLMAMKPADAVQRVIEREQNRIRGFQEQAVAYKLQEAELKEAADHIKTPDAFAKSRAFESYAEAGIDAMKVTEERKLARPVYIGPELGWAGEAYGGHPQEFIELIKESRKEMAKKLENSGYDKYAAAEKAKTHIKGMVDTSHLAMWYKHFGRKENETDEKHLKRFQEWMKDQAKDMVKAGVVGGVQVVDSITGEHSHLPAGQGAFDVAGFVKAMKEAGFNGPIIAEGHEEDTMNLGQGRILTETWKAFGSPISAVPSGGGQLGLRSWGGIQNSYFGHTMRTPYIVGAYVPSNEWSLWSETPFE